MLSEVIVWLLAGGLVVRLARRLVRRAQHELAIARLYRQCAAAERLAPRPRSIP